MRIEKSEIEKILGFILPKEVDHYFNNDLSYKELSKKERDEYILSVIKVLLNDITKSGNHRKEEWEKGWYENFKLFRTTKNIDYLVPKYHGKYDKIRWNGEIIKFDTDNKLDLILHLIFVDSVILEYLKNCDSIFEFGCGPAYHLLRINKYLPDKNLIGCDWSESSQEIINIINDTLNKKITGINFDFFNPSDFNMPENSGIFTVAALEQVGENFEKFIEFILLKDPKICIHFEPIDELLDENILIDNLSIQYFRKRNYLNGFLPYLEELEKQGKIEILKKQRIFYGSYFIEGHSLIIWRSKK
jgi:hypothetical protein